MEYVDMMEKRALFDRGTQGNEEDKESSGEKRKNRALKAAGGTLGASAALSAGGKNLLLGKKKVYHITTEDAWNNNIKDAGILASKGGSGISNMVGINERAKSLFGEEAYRKAVDDTAKFYRDKAKGYTYVTSNPGVLQQYRRSYINPYEVGGSKEAKKSIPKILHVNMDFNKYKKYVPDEDIYININRNQPYTKEYFENLKNKNRSSYEAYKRNAAKGKFDISPEEIIGSNAKMKDRIKHTAKNLPGYIKENPLRFGAGVALSAGGAFAGYKGAKKIKDIMDKKKREQEDASSESKTALEYADMIEKIALSSF